MLSRLFKPRPAKLAGEALYPLVVTQARTPRLYTELGAPDTREGRFELYSLHVYLVLERLKGQGEQAAETAQAFFDAYLSALDNTFREMGVGDMSISKRMRKLGEAFYGRIALYETGLTALPDTGPLAAMLARTVYAGIDASRAPQLATYLLTQRAALAGQPLEAFFAGEVRWADA